MEKNTHEDADAAQEHGARERTPVVVPLRAVVACPGLGLVLTYAEDKAHVDACEGEERGELEDQADKEDLEGLSDAKTSYQSERERTLEPV